MQFVWFVLLLGSLHISQLEKIYTLESTGSMKRNGDFFILDENHKILEENEIN